MKKVTTLLAMLVLVLFSASTSFAQEVSIAAAKDSADGITVTVRGIAVSPSLESASRTSFYIQQDGVGINIFDFGTDPTPPTITVGDSVLVTGEVDTFNGLKEIVVADVSTDITIINSGNTVPAPRVITYEEFIEAATVETDTAKIQGSLVRLVGLMTNPDDWPKDADASSTNVEAKDMNDSTIAIRVLAQTEAIGVTPPSGKFDLIGIVGTYNASQLVPRFESDFLPYYDITFQADLNDAIDSANFVPANHTVTIAGSINDWSTTADTLTDGDADGIYTLTKSLAAGTYQYKYFVSSRQYPNGEWEGDPNNSFTADDNKTLAAVKPNITFNDFSDITFDNVAAYFQVNMQVALLSGQFDPTTRGDVAQIRGSFDGWGGGLEMNATEDPNIYEVFMFLPDFPVGTDINYKFVQVNGDNDNITWEGGDNKILTATDQGLDRTEVEGVEYMTLVANGPDDIPYFDGVTPDKIFTVESSVTFQVDLRPAYYYVADSTQLPSDVQDGTSTSEITGLFANGPLVNKTNGWEQWGVEGLGLRDDLRLYDDGTNGDATAGDSVFSRTFVFSPGDAKEGPALKFGVNGQDNDSGFGADRFPVLEADATLDFIIGALITQDGTPYKELYDPYIDYSEEDGFSVRRRPTDVSIEENSGINPAQYSLAQNYPNPFNPSTNITFDIAEAANVTLEVYNVLGQKVATLVNNQALAAGSYNFNFDASRLASGMYLYRLQAGTFTATKTMTLIK